MSYITEPTIQTAVYKEVDVLVVGGGMAGCTAAVSAANAGAKVILVERNGCLGGVLTSNIIPNILNNHIDSEHRHLLCGVPKLIMERLAEFDGCVKNWDEPMAKLVIDEQKLKVVLIEILQETGVEVVTHALAVKPIIEKKENHPDTVKGIFFETKVGRKAILAKITIDCTGEADIISQTGCPLRITSGTASLAFKMSGVSGDDFCRYFENHPDQFPKNHDGIRDFNDFKRNWEEYGNFYFPHRGGRKIPFVQDDIKNGKYSKTFGKVFGLDMMCLIGLRSMGDISVNSMLWRLPTLDPEHISEAELESQKAVYFIADYFQKAIPGFEKAHVSQISQDIGIRVSRAIEGEKTLEIEDVTSLVPVYADDVIAIRSTKPWSDDGMKDHPFDDDINGIVATQSTGGETTADGASFLYSHTIDIPYGIMLPRKVENILAGSGKTLSSRPQTTMRCGTNSMRPAQGAGVAAAVAALTGTTTHSVDIKKIQLELLRQGVYLGDEKRLTELNLNNEEIEI